MKSVPMKVELLRVDGTELDIVNAARVSFDKTSNVLVMKDKALIKYLARFNHWTPFGHVGAQFRIKAPMFVARQLGKHQVGLVWNEVSRRYVDHEPEFYCPEVWRSRSASAKQGSGDDLDDGVCRQVTALVDTATMSALYTYNALLAADVCPEQARMVLPQNTMTEWIWTGSLAAWARVIQLRLDPHSQKEVRYIAAELLHKLCDPFPHALEALMEK
jgi:thymidylate synthase (FAD)